MGFILYENASPVGEAVCKLAQRRFLPLSYLSETATGGALQLIQRLEDVKPMAVIYTPDAVRVLQTAQIGEACALRSLPLVTISSDKVFPHQGAGPFSEKDTCRPESDVGAMYLEHEETLRRACAQHIVLRRDDAISDHGVADALITIAGAVIQDGFRAWGTYHWGASERLNTQKTKDIFGLEAI